jgi:hypothetical protein
MPELLHRLLLRRLVAFTGLLGGQHPHHHLARLHHRVVAVLEHRYLAHCAVEELVGLLFQFPLHALFRDLVHGLPYVRYLSNSGYSTSSGTSIVTAAAILLTIALHRAGR